MTKHEEKFLLKILFDFKNVSLPSWQPPISLVHSQTMYRKRRVHIACQRRRIVKWFVPDISFDTKKIFY